MQGRKYINIFLNANLEIVQPYQTLLQTLVNRICTLKLTKTGQILGSQEEGRKLRIKQARGNVI